VKRNLRNLAVALAATTALAPVGIAVASHHHDRGHWHGSALWAAPTGTGTACTWAAPCSLATALSTASSGQTVRAMAGTYTGGVMVGPNKIGVPIASPVNLVGEPGAIIDATGDQFGIGIIGSASGTSVRGFTIENALDTGIIVVPGSISAAPALTPPVTNITIEDNRLHDNGLNPTAPGWAIHMMSTTNSKVAGNRAYNNGGGIYLTDEFGPNHGNRIVDNRVTHNLLQCGIILAGHVAAWNPVTMLPTAAGGVYDNLVAHNVAIGNGTTSQGGGILLGGGAPYAAVYSNVIRDNTSIGNGLAGVVIHQHGPGDLNNNVIVGNRVSNDNVGGDPDYPPINLNFPIGILVASGPPGSGAGPITGTVIQRNKISHVTVGIWTLNVPSGSNTISHNRFAASVVTPISAN
jgi:parallel beta-helix repeat protein